MRRNLVIEEILISATPFGVRTALVSDGHIRAFYAESHARPRLLDNIYKAAPGRQGGAARFVTIAAGQSAYMSEASGTNADTADAIVQVVRESAAGKAPRVSTAPALAGRYLVYFPHGANANVARRIDDEAERARLLAIGQSLSHFKTRPKRPAASRSPLTRFLARRNRARRRNQHPFRCG